MANQKQVAIALIIYASDRRDRFPWANSPTEADFFPSTIMEAFEPLRPFLGDPTKVLVCPTDTKRFPTTNPLQSTNLSYFINLSSRMNGTNEVLAGDRHLATNAVPVGAGRVFLTPGTDLSWTEELHRNKKRPPVGVLSFTDGSVEIVANGRAHVPGSALDRAGKPNQTLLVP